MKIQFFIIYFVKPRNGELFGTNGPSVFRVREP